MGGEGGSFRTWEGSTITGARKAKWREVSTEIAAEHYFPGEKLLTLLAWNKWGLSAEAQALNLREMSWFGQLWEYSEEVSRTHLSESRGKTGHPGETKYRCHWNTLTPNSTHLQTAVCAQVVAAKTSKTGRKARGRMWHDCSLCNHKWLDTAKARASAWGSRQKAATAVPTTEVAAANSCEQAQVTAQAVLGVLSSLVLPRDPQIQDPHHLP